MKVSTGAIRSLGRNLRNGQAISLIVVFLMLSSCGPLSGLSGLQKDESAILAVYSQSTSADLTSGINAFDTVVRPVIAAAECKNCHMSQTPIIAAADLPSAYAAAKTRLNLTSVSLSTLLTKALDGHYGTSARNLGQAAWLPQLQTWANAEIASAPVVTNPSSPTNPNPTVTTTPVDPGTPPVYVTQPILLTGTGGNNKTVSLAARGAGFTGVNFLYDLQDPYTAVVNSARIFNPRIQNTTANYIRVKCVRIFQSVDSTINPADPSDIKAFTTDAYCNVDMTIAPNSTTRLSFSESILSKAASEGLYFAFGFQTLETTNAPICQELPTFTTTVFPYLQSKCLGCHASGGSGAGFWNMSSTAATLCVQSMQRVDLTAPIASRMIQRPFYRQAGHPGTSMNQADVDATVNWITLESQ